MGFFELTSERRAEMLNAILEITMDENTDFKDRILSVQHYLEKYSVETLWDTELTNCFNNIHNHYVRLEDCKNATEELMLELETLNTIQTEIGYYFRELEEYAEEEDEQA